MTTKKAATRKPAAPTREPTRSERLSAARAAGAAIIRTLDGINLHDDEDAHAAFVYATALSAYLGERGYIGAAGPGADDLCAAIRKLSKGKA